MFLNIKTVKLINQGFSIIYFEPVAPTDFPFSWIFKPFSITFIGK